MLKLVHRAAVTLTIALPGAAFAAAHDHPLSPVTIFQNAFPVVKLIVGLLVLANVAAVVVCVRKLASGQRLPGGSAFLSGLRLGGPMAGLLGAAWTGLNMAIGLASVTTAVPTYVLARGWAEIMALVVLGLLTGAVAVVANWAVEARIDHAVLRA